MINLNELQVFLTKWVICTWCAGTGVSWNGGTSTPKCIYCNGKGGAHK